MLKITPMIMDYIWYGRYQAGQTHFQYIFIKIRNGPIYTVIKQIKTFFTLNIYIMHLWTSGQ